MKKSFVKFKVKKEILHTTRLAVQDNNQGPRRQGALYTLALVIKIYTSSSCIFSFPFFICALFLLKEKQSLKDRAVLNRRP